MKQNIGTILKNELAERKQKNKQYSMRFFAHDLYLSHGIAEIGELQVDGDRTPLTTNFCDNFMITNMFFGQMMKKKVTARKSGDNSRPFGKLVWCKDCSEIFKKVSPAWGPHRSAENFKLIAGRSFILSCSDSQKPTGSYRIILR